MNKSFFSKLLPDISASIVVFLVALPLCLGIAAGSQAPISSGLISGIIGGVIIGILSGSPLSVSGPAAGLIAVVILAIQNLGSFESFLLAVLLAGILQLIFGFLRFGTLGDFVPNSVIKGMLAAIGIILIIKQIPHFFGYDNSLTIAEDSMLELNHNNIFYELTQIFDNISFVASIIGFVSLLILISFEFSFIKRNKLLKAIPAPLIAVIVGTIINEYFLLTNPEIALTQQHLVSLSQNNQKLSFDSFLNFPVFNQILNPQIWYIAFTIAIIASIETLLCIEAVDKIDNLKRRTSGNRELKAQGIGNIVSGLIGGLPITSVIVRSSANANAGAKTKLSTIFHGVWLFLSIILIPDLLNKIPYSTLASILIFTGFKLANPKILKECYKLGFDQIFPFLITITSILLTNLLIGIFIGILISFSFILRNNFKSAIMIVNDGNNYLMRFKKDVTFLNKAKIKRSLENIPAKSNLIIDISNSDFIDKDIIEVINDFLKHKNLKRIRTEIKRNNYNPLHQLIS